MAKRNLILSLVCVVLSGMLTYAYGQNKRDVGQKYLTRPLPQAWEADTLFLQQQPIEGKWSIGFDYRVSVAEQPRSACCCRSHTGGPCDIENTARILLSEFEFFGRLDKVAEQQADE